MSQSEEQPFSFTPNQDFIDYLDRRIKQAVADALQEQTQQSRYLTRKEVCAAFHFSIPTLCRYVKTGVIKGHRIGNRILFDESELKKSLRDLRQ
jgi:excisionase family DNA binding protein